MMTSKSQFNFSPISKVIFLLLLINLFPVKANNAEAKRYLKLEDSEEYLPTFKLPHFESGEIFESTNLSGHLVYLDFWASWCSPCLESMPFLEQLHLKYSGKNFLIIAVNIDKDKEDAKKFINRTNISYTNLYDPNGTLGKPLNVTTMPMAFLVSPKGEILLKHTGFDPQYGFKLEQTIKNILNSNTEN